MNYSFDVQCKIVGDAYAGFYSAGLSMQDSETMSARFRKNPTDPLETRYTDSEGLVLCVESTSTADNTNRMKGGSADTYAHHSRFENHSNHPVTLEMITSFRVTGIEADTLHRFRSFWSAEGRLESRPITDLNLEKSWNSLAYRIEKFGNVGSMPVRSYFPTLITENSKTGEFFGVQLYSPSSWQMEITVQTEDTLTIAGGIADRDFGQWTKTIAPGEGFEAPKAVTATGRSLLEVCQKLVCAQSPDISPVDDHMGIIFNEYCTTWGNPSTENLKKIADKLCGHGIQYLVMDCGWYAPEGSFWWNRTGHWQPDAMRFPGGLPEATDYIREKGMIPGIWFEFEDVSCECEEYWNAEEQLLKKDGVPLTVGNRRFLDMENPTVIARLEQQVIGLLKENGFGYIKVDYNDTSGMGCDGPESMGENLRRKLLGTQSFFKKMKSEIPSLVIENCSSGGHRLEPSMMELCSQASFSDAHEVPYLPIIAANLHRLIRPEQSQIWAVLRKEDSPARICYSLCATLLGRMGLSGDIYDLSEEQWALVDEGIAFYKKAAPIIQKGVTTVLESDPVSYNQPQGSQLVVREYEGNRLLIFHRFENSMSLGDYLESHHIPKMCFRSRLALSTDTLGNATAHFGSAKSDFSAEAYILPS